MSPIRRFLFLSIFLLSISSSSAVKCDSCEGEKCNEGTCEGDYCILSTFNPKWGSVQSLIKGGRKVVKGCLNNKEMIVKNVKSHCVVNEASGETEFCICKKDKCTSTQKWSTKGNKEKAKKITCECKGDHCNKKKTCEGDLCTYVVDHSKRIKKITKGCMDISIPLFERRMIGACMIPPMTGAMHHEKIDDINDLLNIESCTCATDGCNEKKPVTEKEKELEEMEKERCSFGVNTKTLGKTMETRQGKCKGEFCYRLNINATLGKMSNYDVMGCATFNYEEGIYPIFSSGKCAEVNGENVQVKMCLKTENKMAMEKLIAAVEINEVSIETDEEGKGEEEEESSGKDTIEIEEVKDGDGEEEETKEEEMEKEKMEKGKGKSNNKKKEENNNGASKSDEKVESSTKRFVFVAPTEAAIPDESNATMITVFILIILCICVVGIMWKFQLHRKLMRANYDTVADG